MGEVFVFTSYILIFLFQKIIRLDQISKYFLIAFQTIWFMVLWVSMIRPYGLFKPSDYTYLLLCLNVLSFTIGFYSIRIKNHNNYNIESNKLRNSIIRILNNKLFIAYLLGLMAYEIYLLTKFFEKLAVASSLAALRHDFFYDNFYGESFNFMNRIFLFPTFYIALPLFIFCLLYYRKPITIILAVFLLIYCNLGGGRFDYITIFYTLFFFIFCLQKISWKKIRLIISLGILLFLILSAITASRLSTVSKDASYKEMIVSGADDTLEGFITYTCGASVALDYAIDKDYVSKIGGYQFGKVTASGLLQLINIFTKRIGLTIDEPMTRLLKYKQETYIPVANDRTFNALYTAILFFYLDFGILGVIIIPFFFGFLCRVLIRKFYIYQNVSLLSLLNFAFITAMMSTTDLRGFSLFQSILFIILLYLVGVSNKKLVLRKQLISNI